MTKKKHNCIPNKKGLMKQSKLKERKKKLLRKSCPRVCNYLVACDHPFISFILWTLCRLVYKLLCSRIMNEWING